MKFLLVVTLPSIYQSATKPAVLTLALQKVTEGFTAIIDCPTDTNIIDIRQLLLPFLMKTKYDELTLTHNLSRVILPTERYNNIYLNGAYLILPVIAIYDGKIDKDTTRTEVHRAKGKTKPSEMTVRSTKRPIPHARTSLWKLSTRHDNMS